MSVDVDVRWAAEQQRVASQSPGGPVIDSMLAAARRIMVEDAQEIAKLRAERDTATRDLKHALETLGSEFGVEAWTEQLRLATRYSELARSLADTVDGSEEWSHERLCLWTKREGRRVRHACDLREQRYAAIKDERDRLAEAINHALGSQGVTDVNSLTGNLNVIAQGYARALAKVDSLTGELARTHARSRESMDRVVDNGRRLMADVTTELMAEQKRARDRRVTVEWRQELVHRMAEHDSACAAYLRVLDWRSGGWDVREQRSGRHDVLLVGCRAIIHSDKLRWCEECQDVGSWACSEHAT